eukprot:755938-Hanusia_phi.AAC.5
MAALTQAQVKSWVDDLLEGLASPVDWTKLQKLMSKRVTVEMPGEPKAKKFEDWKKKSEPFYDCFKNAKRTVPKNAQAIFVRSKKDEIEVICPEVCSFVWTSALQEMYPQVTLAPGDKSRIFGYLRFKLSGKSECSWFAPLFSPTDFKQESRADDDDSFLHKLYLQWNEGVEKIQDSLGEEIKAEFPTVGKVDKSGMMEILALFKDCKRSFMPGCHPVMMAIGKDDTSEGIVPVIYTFKWSAALNDKFKLQLADNAEVELRSYDCVTVKNNKVISFAPHFDPETNIKPVGKSGGA